MAKCSGNQKLRLYTFDLNPPKHGGTTLMIQLLHKHKASCILFCIIAVQLLWFTYNFYFEKEGFHSDESWSYCFANANDDTSLYAKGPFELKNFNSWTSTETFREFIEVQRGREFFFGSVFYNMSRDYNPPLHSILLHAVCSFAPGTFSWWYAYVINILAFLLAMPFLYRLGKEYLNSPRLALALCAFYGCTTAAQNTYIYLRIYPLLTAFSIITVYLHCKLLRRHYKSLPLLCLSLFSISVLGYMSHYYFFILTFFLGLSFSVILFAKKRRHTLRFELYAYTATLLLSVFTVFVCFPRSIRALTLGTTLYEEQAPFFWELKRCIHLLIGETTGIPTEWSATQILIALFFTVYVILACRFLMRNEPFLTRRSRKNIRQTLCLFITRIDVLTVCLIFTIIASTAVIACISNVRYMEPFADRYLFMLMPLVAAVFLKITSQVCQKICRRTNTRGILLASLLFTSLLLNHILFPCKYLFQRFDTPNAAPSLTEITKNAEVIVVTSDAWRLVCYSTLLRESNHFFAVLADEWSEHMDSLDRLPADSATPVYVIIEEKKFSSHKIDNTIEDITGEYSTLHWAETANYLHTENSFGGKLSVWRLR